MERHKPPPPESAPPPLPGTPSEVVPGTPGGAPGTPGVEVHQEAAAAAQLPPGLIDLATLQS
eukprot:5752393-Pyramimonas_sp.AAC.1